ncbi:MAG: aromatic amino acid ammonia-lyase [Tannerella sp.]|jgi:histidine ammonia-lyase|nr:aromatic amino acid ammonia-lyase [Tannerella sp.]
MGKTITYKPEKGFSLNDIEELLYGGKKLRLPAKAIQKVDYCYSFLKDFSEEKIIYGINTGFGPMAQYRVDDDCRRQLQYNIIRSHSTGAGKPLEPLYVKASMIARLSTFLQGYSGVHASLVNLITEFINRDIYPYIPEHGSVGASGDLVQLAHIALTLIGEGEVFYKGKLTPTAEVMKAEKLKPFEIYIREGLSVTNGTSVMTGIGIVNLIYARRLMEWAIIASVMMNEIAASYDDMMSPILNGTKRHSGQLAVARRMCEWAQDNRTMKKREIEMYHKHTEKIFKHKVQAYYSLRCVPQILGPVYDELENAEKVLIDELNSACDNPIVDPQTKYVYHGGNFHGDYVSFEMDKLKIAVTKMTMLAERQLNYLCHNRINDNILPPFLNLGVLGLNYGLQAAQFTATSTTAECQTLSNPMYVHSIPNNNDNQDIVSMGTNSSLMARTVIENGFQVMSIHFMALVQAVDYLKIQKNMSKKTYAIYDEIRSFFPIFADDTPKYKDIERMNNYLTTKNLYKNESA